jgi:hypothetical protein
MVVDLNVHWGRTASGEDQPYAHVMLTMREIGPEGFGKEVREWKPHRAVDGLAWALGALANERLAELGHDIRIDHLSHVAQGIALEPQNKIGPAGQGARRECRAEADPGQNSMVAGTGIYCPLQSPAGDPGTDGGHSDR